MRWNCRRLYTPKKLELVFNNSGNIVDSPELLLLYIIALRIFKTMLTFVIEQ